MKKNAFDRVYAVAVGRGSFPFDMLRYDACFPAFESYSLSLRGEGIDAGPRVIILARYRGQPGSWTPARWESFLWSIRTFESEYEARDHARAMIESLFPAKKEETRG